MKENGEPVERNPYKTRILFLISSVAVFMGADKSVSAMELRVSPITIDSLTCCDVASLETREGARVRIMSCLLIAKSALYQCDEFSDVQWQLVRIFLLVKRKIGTSGRPQLLTLKPTRPDPPK